jgi:hypothetical protein
MGKVKKAAYKLYKRWQNNWLVATCASFFYIRILPSFFKYQAIPAYSASASEPGLSKIAFVCDEMTWQDFKNECNGVFITPYNWLDVFRIFKPDIFFCESAWSGIDKYKDCWRGRIYKNEKVRYENRKDLTKILDYCKKNKIPTVFWNKEDPTFFGSKTYNFVDTALKFDHIMTTAEECITRYHELGHPSVHTLMFGFSPSLFFPKPSVLKEKKAVFAGSWYADQPDRCKDMSTIFDMVLEQGISLEIYNRQSGSANPIHRFPEKYLPYLHQKVPFQQMGEIFREAEYAINVNTVKDSYTMFARRVFEVMACGCIVISNDSLAMKKLFPGRIWFFNEGFNYNRIPAIREQNLQETFQKHTCNHRLHQVLEVCKREFSL